MLESLGSLTGSPWIYAVVALSVLLDVFLPVLPSGVLVITAATAAAAGSTTVVSAADRVAHVPQVAGQVPSLFLLMVCAAVASVLGDLAAFRLAWRGGDRLERAIARAQEYRDVEGMVVGNGQVGLAINIEVARGDEDGAVPCLKPGSRL